MAILELKTFHWRSKWHEMEQAYRAYFRYYHWILHKKVVRDEIVIIFHRNTHISLDIGSRVSNAYTLEYPFPLAGQSCIGKICI